MSNRRIRVWQYGFSIAVGAFLLFQVQPLIAKFILPWFGGAPAVWTTAMLFFQAALLAGYAYGHLLSRWTLRTQARCHLAVLAISLVALPIIPDDGWRMASSSPTRAILGLLAITVGLPYFVTATTSPLLQGWMNRDLGRSPYRLFALSNATSLLGLLTYPFVVEPLLPARAQAVLWSVLFAVYCVATGIVAVALARARDRDTAADTPSTLMGTPPSRWQRVRWFVLTMLASALLLAGTNEIVVDLAPTPLFWVVPLALYLTTFIIAFDRPSWYRRGVVGALLLVTTVLSHVELTTSFVTRVALLCAWVFIGCLACHGEVSRQRPDARYLAVYYLVIAAGGVVGGLLVALAAPALFSTFFEVEILSVAVPAGWILCSSHSSSTSMRLRWRRAALTASFVLIPGLAVALIGAAEGGTVLATQRGFFGVLKVIDVPSADAPRIRVMVSGTTQHGAQLDSLAHVLEPTSYYGRDSGVGQAFQRIRDRGPTALRVGIVGLGVGTLAAYGRRGDEFVFYEINPAVVDIANEYFSYLRYGQARTDIRLGDARTVIEKELRGSYEPFDLLVVDAFSSDSVPAHLLTVECFASYLRRIRQEGLLAIHISNRHLELDRVVVAAARRHGVSAVIIRNHGDDSRGTVASKWVILGRGDIALEPWSDVSVLPAERDLVLWTDRHNAIFSVLK